MVFIEVMMNPDTISGFSRKYRISGIEVRRNTRTLDLGYGGLTREYVSGPSEIDLTIEREGLMTLIKLDKKAEEEYNIRMNNSAVADAYEKYQMLLALCK
jgi:hypothetical protein